MRHLHKFPAFTLLELVVVIAIIGVLMALLLPAVQSARSSARRLDCSNRMRQVALALHQFHDSQGRFPDGLRSDTPSELLPRSTWIVAVLPHLEQAPLWDQTNAAFAQVRSPFNSPPHNLMAHPLSIVACPADGRTSRPQTTRRNRLVGLTSFLGVSGTNLGTGDGILFGGSRVTLAEITDGSSNTLLIGERPPSPDFFYGWWYAGVGQHDTGSVTIVLGVREVNVFGDTYGSCFDGPYPFSSGRIDQPCDRFHFWSLHDGGGNFALADGSVRFMAYSANGVMPALSTRAGGESGPLP